MTHAVLAAVLAVFSFSWGSTWYPEGKAPETDEEREARHQMVGGVVASVALENETAWGPVDDAALIEAVWAHESDFEYFVHAGGDSPIGHQDHGLARCMGQIHTWPGNKHLPTKADHQALAGLDRAATERCARVTLAYFWGHAQRCIRTNRSGARRWVEPLADWEAAKLFAAYGKGYCAPVAAKHKNRARTFRRIRAALYDRQAH